MIIDSCAFSRFDLADTVSSDRGKTLRVQLKFPGKAVFTVWEPEDDRLSKIYGLPAANLTNARKIYSKQQKQVEEEDFKRHLLYNEKPQRSESALGPSCGHRRLEQLSMYTAYGFGIPEIFAEFFDRNFGLFILLMTVSGTISAASGNYPSSIHRSNTVSRRGSCCVPYRKSR